MSAKSDEFYIHLFGGPVEGGDGLFLGESCDDDSPCIAVIPDSIDGRVGPEIVRRVNQARAFDALLAVARKSLAALDAKAAAISPGVHGREAALNADDTALRTALRDALSLAQEAR